MYDYRLTLSLSEAAEVLGTDITSILEQNSLDPSKCLLPRIGIESEPFGYGYIFNMEKFNKKMSGHINSGEQQTELKHFLQSTALCISEYSSGQFFYLHKNDVDIIRRGGTLTVGGFYDDSDFTAMWTTFLKKSIFVDLPEDKRHREGCNFDSVRIVFEENSYVSYTTPIKKEIRLENLRLRAIDVQAFIKSKSGDLSQDEVQIAKSENSTRFEELERLNASLVKSNESLRSQIYEIEKVFGEQIRSLLYPVAKVILEFPETDQYQKFIKYRKNKGSVKNSGLKNLKDWIRRSYPEFKTERSSDFIKNLIDQYYT